MDRSSYKLINVPVHNARKFSQVFGQISANSSKMILPAKIKRKTDLVMLPIPKIQKFCHHKNPIQLNLYTAITMLFPHITELHLK